MVSAYSEEMRLIGKESQGRIERSVEEKEASSNRLKDLKKKERLEFQNLMCTTYDDELKDGDFI